ncbi:response regulator [Niallia oryzisoli]|uniref:Response regulator n=1 Tax=Niallia oryzisoli TaxID=1737571 RepID=A0ABZ2CFF9_9BACI
MKRKEDEGERKLILLIDDDPEYIMYLKDTLGEIGWVVMAAADPDRALNSYYDLRPDCVMINAHMKAINGLDVLVKLKEGMRQQFIPTIMISRDPSKETRIESYRLGADDFILIPFDMDELIVRINRQLERKQAIDDVMLLDELTRVYNRKYLQPSFERLVSQYKRRNVTFSMALIDLDCFKQVNEAHGHAAGDYVLVSFAEMIKNTVRQSDIVIRYRSDKFLLLLPGARAEDTKQVLERIRRLFSKQKFTDIQHHQAFHCTFSAGVHEIQEDELDLQRNIEIVNQALYEAKQEGRNLVKVVPVNNIRYHQKQIHVGIVDDDPIIRAILTDLISKSNFTEVIQLDIQTFKDGMEFIESNWYSESTEPYLIILDGMMPRMDGIEVLQKLRGLSFQDRYTIIMLTSRKSEQDISRAIQLGADDYITKPFKPLELETRLGYLIKRMI